MMNKQVRCHILDRKDDLEQAVELYKDNISKTVFLEQLITEAKDNLESHMTRIEKLKKHIDYLESTMHIDWVDNPPY